MIIYSIKDLQNKPFDDEEIDIVTKSLIYSLIIGMFSYMRIKKTEKEIISLCKKDNWFNEFTWTEQQRNIYKQKLNKIFYNLYRFGPIKCNNTSEEWLIKYGFIVKNMSNKKHKKK